MPLPASSARQRTLNQNVMETALAIAQSQGRCELGVCVTGCRSPGHLVYHPDISCGEKKIATIFSGRAS